MDLETAPAAYPAYPARDAAESSPAAGLTLSFEQAPVGILQLDMAGVVMRANERICRMLGWHPDGLEGKHYRWRVADSDLALVQAALEYTRCHPGLARQCEVQLRRKDGAGHWVQLTCYARHDPGCAPYYLWWIADLAPLKEHEARLAFHHTHDKVTGLPNRELFMDRLQQAMLHAQRRGDMLALLCIGIDNYNLVNESLGHAAGDQVLAGAAQRLRAGLRDHDTAALLGGNEFVVILEELQHAAGVMPVCENLFASLAPALPVAGQQVHAAASIGITLYPQDGKDSATLLRYADMALTRARDQGGGKYQYFSSEMNHRTLERIGMEAALRLAVFRDELQLQYQPLADLQTGATASLEALVRWQHPVLGLISANRFVPVAEDAGLIHAIGNWVLRRACHDLRSWRDAGLPPLRVALNVSPRQFRNPDFANGVVAALTEFNLPPDALALEITESVLMLDSPATATTLDQLKNLGVSLVLDDFGTGYSSLSNLKRYPFDSVKIDCAYIRDIVTDTGDAALAKTIISMAHNLGIQVTAEGVETEAQCDFLRRHMCDLIQGYFYSPPLKPDEVLALQQSGRALPSHLLRIQQQRRSLLLVDDEQNIVSALKRLLRRDGYEMYTANSGQQGLDVLAQHEVDVIVSDQRMPGMLGADFLRKAKELYPDTIRIMLSGYTELQSVTDAVNEGAIYKFLTKPWEDELLRGHIADAFRLKGISDDNERLNLEVRTANQELAAANRRMGELLAQKQQQISHGEVSLHVARELLQHVPLPVLGLDDEGMIAFVNAAADHLFRHAGALLGNEAALVLPDLFPSDGGPLESGHATTVGDTRFMVTVCRMGEQSASRGSLVMLSRDTGAV